ncbi:MAG TPA: SgcJ/EcaC family oxidoreductase [Micromonosporaceae bacterium]|nr:SgcJ/EcaC family oxidoreductase [Micromonosporaceae bacterium]
MALESRRVAVLGLTLLAVTGLSACKDEDSPTSPSVAEVTQAVQRLVDAAAAAWAAKDADAFAAVYAPDSRFYDPIGNVSTGRAAIAGYHSALFAGPFASSMETQEIKEVRLLTDAIAIVHLIAELTGVASEDLPPGLSHTVPGVVRTTKTWVVLKQGSGWEIVSQHMAPVAPGVS